MSFKHRFYTPLKECPRGVSGGGAEKVPLHLYSAHLQCSPSGKRLLPACTIKRNFVVNSNALLDILLKKKKTLLTQLYIQYMIIQYYPSYY